MVTLGFCGSIYVSHYLSVCLVVEPPELDHNTKILPTCHVINSAATVVDEVHYKYKILCIVCFLL